MKEKFDKRYERIRTEMIETAKLKISNFLKNKNSKITIEARLVCKESDMSVDECMYSFNCMNICHDS